MDFEQRERQRIMAIIAILTKKAGGKVYITEAEIADPPEAVLMTGPNGMTIEVRK